jgi:nucleolar protein 56
MPATFVLFETASGLALFEQNEGEEIAADEASTSYADYKRLTRAVTLKAFNPFPSAEVALDNASALSEGMVTDFLRNFLESNLPSSSKKGKFIVAVQDAKLAASLQEEFGYSCDASNRVAELSRGLRLYFTKFIPQLSSTDQEKAQLGLSHSYSRAKVKFNVNRVDNMVIQSIAMVDQLDKDLNTFSMRVKEWYGWHFPELVKIVSDNLQYSKLAVLIKNKSKITEALIPEMEAIVEDSDKANQIFHASRASMGTDVSEVDMMNIESFARRVISLTEYRKNLHQYLVKKMNSIAPNLTALIGEQVGARLIAHAGSLTNLAKYPASTVQILGAEKALFRALKTKSNTPKYGLIFNSTFIGRAGSKNKGRISRYLANKCSIASRIDCFTEVPSSIFGSKMREQVEERLKFFETGEVPRKNVDVMGEAVKEAASSMDVEDEEEEVKPKSSKKKKAADSDVEMGGHSDDEEESSKKKDKKKKKEKKEKKEKKSKKVEEDENEEEEESPKKKKKDKKKDKKEKKEKKDKKMKKQESDDEDSD